MLERRARREFYNLASVPVWEPLQRRPHLAVPVGAAAAATATLPIAAVAAAAAPTIHPLRHSHRCSGSLHSATHLSGTTRRTTPGSVNPVTRRTGMPPARPTACLQPVDTTGHVLVLPAQAASCPAALFAEVSSRDARRRHFG